VFINFSDSWSCLPSPPHASNSSNCKEEVSCWLVSLSTIFFEWHTFFN
jgi:hypothetical protein